MSVPVTYCALLSGGHTAEDPSGVVWRTHTMPPTDEPFVEIADGSEPMILLDGAQLAQAFIYKRPNHVRWSSVESGRAANLVDMSALLTLLGFFIFGVALLVMYKARNLSPKWRSPQGTGYPESMNAGLQAERVMPRPPWPVDGDGNPESDRS